MDRDAALLAATFASAEREDVMDDVEVGKKDIKLVVFIVTDFNR